jgi:excinuclease ABC subunit C
MAKTLELAQALKQLPDQPGVYRMYDVDNTLIYVGKAKVLKNRVRSYFVGSHTPKVAAMVSQVHHFDTIIAQSEVEALILEANLIKANKPKYNILLRDDKKYPWIALSDDAFPRLYVTRSPEKRGKTRYFGPYASSGDLYATLQAIKRHFPLRQRRKPLFKTRPCMNYYIGTCLGPCQKLVTQQAYDQLVRKVELFLKGKGDTLKDLLLQEMDAASEQLNFEHAARIRDTLKAVDTVIARQRVVSTDTRLNQDIIALATDDRRLIGVVLQVRQGKLIASRTHRLQRIGEGLDDAAPLGLLTAFMLRHYDVTDTVDYPDAVVIPDLPTAVDQALDTVEEASQSLCNWLSQQAGRIITVAVARGNHQRELCQMAERNALDALKQAQFDDANSLKADPTQVLMELQAVLQLPAFPRRIECYDISHFQGSHTVASMVVFVDAKPDKAAYRRFKIEVAEGKPDDFASMNEVIRRRFEHSALFHTADTPTTEDPEKTIWEDPDLLIIDGGKGQLGAACDALMAHGLEDQPVVSLAKKFEEVFRPGESRPVVIPRDSSVLFLLQQIRDEAHRFAITYHRQLRGKAATQSALGAVKGLGTVNKQKLMATYGSIEAIMSATPAEVAATLGVSQKRVTTFLNQLAQLQKT